MSARVAGLLLSLAALAGGCDGGPATTGLPLDAAPPDSAVIATPDGGGADRAIIADAVLADLSITDARGDAPPADADPAVVGCQDICLTQAMVACPLKRDCLPGCLREIEGRCKNTTRAFVACARTLTTASYLCNTNSYAQLRPDACQNEAAAASHCALTDDDHLAPDAGTSPD
jgi:hypothetical protein